MGASAPLRSQTSFHSSTKEFHYVAFALQQTYSKKTSNAHQLTLFISSISLFSIKESKEGLLALWLLMIEEQGRRNEGKFWLSGMAFGRGRGAEPITRQFNKRKQPHLKKIVWQHLINRAEYKVSSTYYRY